MGTGRCELVGVVGVGLNQRYRREEEEERGKGEEACGLLVWSREMGLKKKEEEKRTSREGEQLGGVGLKSERRVQV